LAKKDNATMETPLQKLALVEYLQTHTVEQLKEEFDISSKPHKEFPNLILFKYGIKSPKAHDITRDSRGIILDSADSWKPISFPYRRFFNYGEGVADTIDWTSAKVYHKLDGSLIPFYWAFGKWNVATSGTPDADTPLSNTTTLTFKQLFLETFKELGYLFPKNEDQDKTFVFEFMSIHNQVVVKYPKADIQLTGVRNINTYQEYDPSIFAAKYNWKAVGHIPLNTIEDVLSSAESLNGVNGEGYVVCDANFNRIKIKSPSYVALHHLKGGLNSVELIDTVLKGEGDELISYFQEYKEIINDIQNKVINLENTFNLKWESVKHLESMKDFALACNDSPLFSILIAKKKNKMTDLRLYLKECSDKSKKVLLDKF
jgi:hypothetical protein